MQEPTFGIFIACSSLLLSFGFCSLVPVDVASHVNQDGTDVELVEISSI